MHIVVFTPQTGQDLQAQVNMFLNSMGPNLMIVSTDLVINPSGFVTYVIIYRA
jgi:hypothetical protein